MPGALSQVDNLKIAHAVAQGATRQEIATALGVSTATISRRRKSLKAMIEALSVEYFHAAAPMAVDSTLKALKATNEILTHAENLPIEEKVDFLAKAKDMLAVTDKKEARVLVSMGISPSPSTSIFVQNLMIGGQTVLLSPQIVGILGQDAAARLCPPPDQEDVDVIDVECSGDD